MYGVIYSFFFYLHSISTELCVRCDLVSWEFFRSSVCHLFFFMMRVQYNSLLYVSIISPVTPAKQPLRYTHWLPVNTSGNQHLLRNRVKIKLKFWACREDTLRCILSSDGKNSDDESVSCPPTKVSAAVRLEKAGAGLLTYQASRQSVKLGAGPGPGRGRRSRAAASGPPRSPRWPPPRCRCCPARRPRTRKTPGLAPSVSLRTWCQRSGRWWRPTSAAAGYSQTPPHSHQGRSPPPLSRSQSRPERGPPSACTPDTSS